jgi:hypothetical protein
LLAGDTTTILRKSVPGEFFNPAQPRVELHPELAAVVCPVTTAPSGRIYHLDIPDYIIA